jgi:hypothetical protein
VLTGAVELFRCHAHHNRLRRGTRRDSEAVLLSQVREHFQIRPVCFENKRVSAERGNTRKIAAGLVTGDQKTRRPERSKIDAAREQCIIDRGRTAEAADVHFEFAEPRLPRLLREESLRIGDRDWQIDEAELNANTDFTYLAECRPPVQHRDRAGDKPHQQNALAYRRTDPPRSASPIGLITRLQRSSRQRCRSATTNKPPRA